MRKIYVVGTSYNYANWMQGEITMNMEEADLVVFTGGEDVSPSYYGASVHPKTYTNEYRDEVEKKAFNKALLLGIPMCGICRGLN